MHAPDFAMDKNIEVDVLVVGAGPAGASLAVFLAHLGGVRALVISSEGSPAANPRAHIMNAACLECFRDVGLESEMTALGAKKDKMRHTRFCDTFLGEEYGRLHSWGTDPDVLGAYAKASPCEHCDTPQTIMEPILLREASVLGTPIRFNTEFLSFSQDEAGVTTTVRDRILDFQYTIRSKYLVGCDGGRSRVMEQLGIPMLSEPSQGLAISVHFTCDLSPWMESRVSNLTHTLWPGKPAPPWAISGILRPVKPWSEWLMVLIPSSDAGRLVPSPEAYMERVKELIGPDCPPCQFIATSVWRINETVASRFSEGRVFCAGDAAHRHPPMNGLGSNTCVQDAYNLAWKLAYVLKGQAGANLLDSYSLERQPIGAGIIKRANDGYRDHSRLWAALGLGDPSEEGRKKVAAALAELKSPTPEGAVRRKAWRAALENCKREFNGLGAEMNQQYRSDAIFLDDEIAPPALQVGDPALVHTVSTYPGSRLPHAWLSTPIPSTRKSTHDLAGKGAFALFTGIGGDAWVLAASAVSERLGVAIRATAIGQGQAVTDLYRDWERLSEVEEDGCVLVRPDRTVAWRAETMIADPAAKLLVVLRSILSLG